MNIRMNQRAMIATLMALSLVIAPVPSFAQETESDEQLPPEVILISYPREVVKNKKVTVEWSSDGEFCNASGGWSGKKAAAGSETIKVKKNQKFMLECFDEDSLTSGVRTTAVKVVKKVKKTSAPMIRQFAFYDGTGNQYAIVTSGAEGSLKWNAPNAVACKASSKNEDWSGLIPASGEQDVIAKDNDRFALKCMSKEGVFSPEWVISVETGVSMTQETILKNLSFKDEILVLQDPRTPDWPNTVARGSQAQFAIEGTWNGSVPVKTIDLWQIPFTMNFPDYINAKPLGEQGLLIDGMVKVISPRQSLFWQFDGNFVTTGQKTLSFSIGGKTFTRQIKVQDCVSARPGDPYTSCKD